MRTGQRCAPVVRAPGRRENAHSERRRKRRDTPADGAESDDAECFALELDEEGARPLSGSHAAIHRRNLTRDREHERQRMLGDRVGVDARRVRDGDAALATRIEVHVIGSRSPDRDHPEGRTFVEHAFSEP